MPYSKMPSGGFLIVQFDEKFYKKLKKTDELSATLSSEIIRMNGDGVLKFEFVIFFSSN